MRTGSTIIAPPYISSRDIDLNEDEQERKCHDSICLERNNCEAIQTISDLK